MTQHVNHRASDEIIRLRAEVERLTRERDNWKAHAISRGKRLRQARDRFIGIKDEIDDEGDRVYFGSSNHADVFKEEVAWLDAFTWDEIMGEPEDWDLLGALEKQKARAEAAERKLVRAVEELQTCASFLHGEGGKFIIVSRSIRAVRAELEKADD